MTLRPQVQFHRMSIKQCHTTEWLFLYNGDTVAVVLRIAIIALPVTFEEAGHRHSNLVWVSVVPSDYLWCLIIRHIVLLRYNSSEQIGSERGYQSAYMVRKTTVRPSSRTEKVTQ